MGKQPLPSPTSGPPGAAWCSLFPLTIGSRGSHFPDSLLVEIEGLLRNDRVLDIFGVTVKG